MTLADLAHLSTLPFRVSKLGEQTCTDAFRLMADPPLTKAPFKATPARKGGNGEGAMLDSKRYLYNALECLSVAQVAHAPADLFHALVLTAIKLSRSWEDRRWRSSS
jgi:hypothetical protein